MRKGDKLVIALILLLGIGGLIGSKYLISDYQGKYLLIRTLHDGEGQRVPLESRDMDLDVEGPLGVSHVEIKDGRARISSSPCPDQVCVQVFGWISQQGALSVCLPNQVMLQVEEQEGIGYGC